MPIMEYYCKECDRYFLELLPKYQEYSICKTCKRKARKVMSAPSVIKVGGKYTAANNYGLKKD